MTSRFGVRAASRSGAKSGSAPDVMKDLRIKLGITKRLQKEVKSYEKELVDQNNKIAKMREDGKDIYDIRKQEEVLAETEMMIPDSKNRCDESIQNLQKFLADNEAELASKSEEAGNEKMKELYVEAKELLNDYFGTSSRDEVDQEKVAEVTSTMESTVPIRND